MVQAAHTASSHLCLPCWFHRGSFTFEIALERHSGVIQPILHFVLFFPLNSRWFKFIAILLWERAILVGKRAIILAILAPCWLGQRANLVVCSLNRREGPMLLGGAKSMGAKRHAFQPGQA